RWANGHSLGNKGRGCEAGSIHIAVQRSGHSLSRSLANGWESCSCLTLAGAETPLPGAAGGSIYPGGDEQDYCDWLFRAIITTSAAMGELVHLNQLGVH